jgi:hypothetical protein
MGYRAVGKITDENRGDVCLVCCWESWNPDSNASLTDPNIESYRTESGLETKIIRKCRECQCLSLLSGSPER